MLENSVLMKPIGVYDTVRGMSQISTAHMIPEQCWWETYNFRFESGAIKQTPPEDLLFNVMPGALVGGITALAPLTIDATSTVVIVLNGSVDIYVIDFANETATPFPLSTVPSTDGTGFYRWSHVCNANKLYFTNLNAGLFSFDGTTVADVISAGPTYKAKYVDLFYGHLVIANLKDGGSDYPLRIAYSDKDDYADFDPLTTNEADFFDLDDNESNSLFGYGITGAKRIGDQFAIHTPGSIWTMRYVGFENGVMEFSERVSGLGCWLPHALVSFDRFHVFPSQDDFYIFDGASIQSIGRDIRQFFFNDLTQDPRLRQFTWGTVDTKRQEIRWYYPSRESTDSCDKCLVLNWPDRTWYVEAGFSRSAVLYGGFNTFRTIDSLSFYSTTIDGLSAVSDTIDGLGVNNIIPYTVYANLTTTSIYTDDLDPQIPEGTDPSVNWPQGYLISRDFDLRQPGAVKDIDQLILDASQGTNQDITNGRNGNFYGWDVYVAVRNFFHEPVQFNLHGQWDGTKFTKRVNIRLAGRIVRFKFATRNIVGTTFTGFTSFVYAGTSER